MVKVGSGASGSDRVNGTGGEVGLVVVVVELYVVLVYTVLVELVVTVMVEFSVVLKELAVLLEIVKIVEIMYTYQRFSKEIYKTYAKSYNSNLYTKYPSATYIGLRLGTIVHIYVLFIM